MFKNLIGGEWLAGPRVSRNINPSDTRDVVGVRAGRFFKRGGTRLTTVHPVEEIDHVKGLLDRTRRHCRS